MKKLLKFILLLVVCCCLSVSADSTCSYTEKHDLNTEVSHVKIKYDIKTGIFTDGVSGCDGNPEACEATYDYFDVSILNMSENFFVIITNNFNDDRIQLSWQDKDENGAVHFAHEYIMQKVTYTFSFYASGATGCSGKKIKTYTKAFPRKNLYHYEALCDDIADSDICQEYVFFDEMEYKSFYNVAQKQKVKVEEAEQKAKEAEENNNIIDKTVDFVIDYKWYFLVAVVLVGGAVFIATTRKKGDK